MVIALVAVAAFAHATWNLTVKQARTSGTRFLWLTFLVGAIVFAPLGILSIAQQGVPLLQLVGLAAGSALMQLAYFLLLQRGYRLADVSIVYPMARGSGPLLSVVFAIILFGERPGVFVLIGAAVVITGVVVIGFAGGRGRYVDNRVGILYGLLVGVVIAGYTLWDANAVVHERMPPVGYYWVSLVIQLLAFAPVALRRPTATLAVARQQTFAVVIVGLLAPLAYVLILFAFQLAPVSIVAPAREVSVVIVAIAGAFWLKEPHPVQRIVGAAIVLAGVAILAVG